MPDMILSAAFPPFSPAFKQESSCPLHNYKTVYKFVSYSFMPANWKIIHIAFGVDAFQAVSL